MFQYDAFNGTGLWTDKLLGKDVQIKMCLGHIALTQAYP